MENGAGYVSAINYQRQIEQAEKKITSLETQYHKSKHQEKLYHEEVLAYHKRAAKLEQNLLLADRKNSKFLVLIQEAEKQNKTLKTNYLEACKKICELEVRNRCMLDRESYFENQVEFANKSLKLMEHEYAAAVRKAGEFHQGRKLIEKKRMDAVEQLYELQAKNAELEASLQFIKRRKCCVCSGKDCETQSKEELMECDRELSDGNTESRLYVIKREKDAAVEQLHHVEREVLESERRNSELRQQVAELTLTITERDHQIRQCKQLFQSTRRNYQDEVCKLEGSVFHWQTKYEQSLMEVEKEASTSNENTENQITEDHEACWELQLRACQNDVKERDITIAYLQKLKNTHEDKIRHIFSEYQQDICNQKLSSHGTTIPDLHSQLQLLLAFYKKRSDNATAELSKWKELAVEARLCREKETALFESQLSLISKQYYAKYEICRESFEKEKSRRLALEGQVNRLLRHIKECERQLQTSKKELEEQRELHESLVTENNNNIRSTVTQQHKACHPACSQQENVVSMADVETNQPECPTEQPDELEEPHAQLKYEITEGERDTQNIVEISVPIEDALDKATDEDQAKPVAAKNLMENQINDFVNGASDNKEVFVDDESLNMEVENLRSKNAELQALCERLVRERDEQAAGRTIDAGHQSNDLASKCEIYENEIQKLKQEITEASAKYSALEESNLHLKTENQRLDNLVNELQARIRLLESVDNNEVTDNSNTMTTETPKDSAEVVEAKLDSAKEVEDALNESFAAQDIQSSPEEFPDGVKSPGEDVSGEVIMEEPGESAPKPSAPDKQPSPHASLPRSKFPSAASTTAIPFKRHSHAGISHRPTRPRAGSTELVGSVDRRASFGSDTSDTVNVEDEGKHKFVPKKFSTSHLDAFKPKPFKKQASLSDDIHLYSRPAGMNSPTKADSTGSASDTESVQSPTAETDPSSQSTASPSPKQPPATLPKPRKPSAETTPQAAEDSSKGDLV